MTTHSMKRSGTKNIVTYRNELVGNTAYNPSSTIVTGGTLFSDATYYYQAFTNSAILNVTNGSLTADILVVAGGGGGGRSDRGGGGGGAGGLQGFTSQTLTAGSYLVTVGAGGGAASASDTTGTSGNNSQFAALTASVGGGGGGRTGNTALSGGSGGGAGHQQQTSSGAGTTGQGNAGGFGQDNGSNQFNGGGGGGASAVGAGGISGSGGGAGSSAYSAWGLATTTGQNVSGTVYYAGGGGGGRQAITDLTPGPGGNGGGGGSVAGTSGLANSGGGGVGGTGVNASNVAAGNGGSGIVIVRYLKSAVTSVQADFELIGTVLVTATTSSVTFTGIPQTYKHLQLRVVGRTDRASSYDGAKIRFNGGTSIDYAFSQLTGNGTAVNAYRDAAALYWYLGLGSFEAATSASGAFGVAICDILDAFNTSKNKTMRSLSGSISVPSILLQSGLWVDTSAISSIAIQPDTGTNWAIGSRFSLYGVRG